jgi:mannosyltransferase
MLAERMKLGAHKRANLSILWLGLIFLIAAGTRFVYLNRQALFLDEAWSWAASQLTVAEILGLPLHDPHPVLYYLLLKFFLLFSPASEAGLRALSVLASLAALGVIVYAARKWWGLEAAFLAACFYALSSFDLYFAQEARMYTLLGLLWVLSYFLLVESLDGHPRLLLGWGLVSALLAWTHLYGLLIAAFQLAILLTWQVWRRVRGQRFPIPGPILASASSIAFLGALPVAYIAIHFQASGAGGAWIPDSTDLLDLFSLITTGIAPVREHFIGGGNLVLPALAGLPSWSWALGGAALSGVFALIGLQSDWKQPGIAHWRAAFGLVMLSVPALIFGYTWIFQRQQWAFKPFLGAAYIFYLWAGAGLSRTPLSIRNCAVAARTGVIAALMLVGLASWIPYFSSWQKSDLRTAFSTLQTSTDSAVFMDPAYLAPLAFYYRQDSSPVWGLRRTGSGELFWGQATRGGLILEDFQPLACDAPQVRQISQVWIYSASQNPTRILDSRPDCLADTTFYAYQNQRWTPLTP